MTQPLLSIELEFSGKMGAMVRAHDWGASPLGEPAAWPPPLRKALAACLHLPIVASICWGAEFRLIYNDLYAQVLGSRHPAALGRPFTEIWPNSIDRILPKLQQVHESGVPLELVHDPSWLDHGGAQQVHWSHSIRPIKGDDGRTIGLLVLAYDMTDRVRAQRRQLALRDAQIAELRATQEALHQAQTMEAIDQLTGGIGHELNNLLQVISGNALLIGRVAAGNEKVQQRVATLHSAVSRGAELASQLLAFGREPLLLPPKTIHPGRLVAGMDDLLRRSLGTNIELNLAIAADVWNIAADPNQLQNAMLNLVLNARDAMAGRGRLTIDIGNATRDRTEAGHHPGTAAGPHVCIAVTNTNTGGDMPAEVAAETFDPLFATRPVDQGSSLAVICGFLKQSGGSAKIDSQPGQGTTVRLYLPRSVAVEAKTTGTTAGPAVGKS